MAAPDRNQKEILLEVEGLKVYFPVYGGVLQRKVAEVKAVDGVSFTVHLRHIAPDVYLDGHVHFYVNGKAVDFLRLSKKDMKPYRRYVQMIFQDPYASLNQRLTVEQIIAEPMELHHPEMGEKEIKEKVAWLLEKVGLQPEYAMRFPHEFSGGQLCAGRLGSGAGDQLDGRFAGRVRISLYLHCPRFVRGGAYQ